MVNDNEYLFKLEDAIKRYDNEEKDANVLRDFNKELQGVYSKYNELVKSFKDEHTKERFMYDLNIVSGILYSVNCAIRLFDMTVSPKDHPEEYS